MLEQASDLLFAANRALTRADAYCVWNTSCPFHTQGKGAVQAVSHSAQKTLRPSSCTVVPPLLTGIQESRSLRSAGRVRLPEHNYLLLERDRACYTTERLRHATRLAGLPCAVPGAGARPRRRRELTCNWPGSPRDVLTRDTPPVCRHSYACPILVNACVLWDLMHLVALRLREQHIRWLRRLYRHHC